MFSTSLGSNPGRAKSERAPRPSRCGQGQKYLTADGGRGAHRGRDDALGPAADPLSDLSHQGRVLDGA